MSLFQGLFGGLCGCRSSCIHQMYNPNPQYQQYQQYQNPYLQSNISQQEYYNRLGDMLRNQNIDNAPKEDIKKDDCIDVEFEVIEPKFLENK